MLALPLVTALGAAVAAARSMDRSQREGNDAVFTTTFREFAATWRRTLVPGVAAAVPFFGLSVPVYLALLSLGDDQASTDT